MEDYHHGACIWAFSYSIYGLNDTRVEEKSYIHENHVFLDTTDALYRFILASLVYIVIDLVLKIKKWKKPKNFSNRVNLLNLLEMNGYIS